MPLILGGFIDGEGDTDSILNFDTTKFEWTQIGWMGQDTWLHGFGVVLMNDIADFCKYVAAPDIELFSVFEG